MENEYIGRIVIWEDERWYVDNTDENFKDDNEETSLFLLPEKYADEDEKWKSGRSWLLGVCLGYNGCVEPQKVVEIN